MALATSASLATVGSGQNSLQGRVTKAKLRQEYDLRRTISATRLGSGVCCPQMPYRQRLKDRLSVAEKGDTGTKTHTLPPLQWSRVEALRLRVHFLVEHPWYSTASRAFAVFIVLVILLSIVAFVVETVPSTRDDAVWPVLEVIFVVVFSVEVVLRVISTERPLRLCRTGMFMADILAIAPFYIELAVGNSGAAETLRVLRIIRLVRVFRIFKMQRYSTYMKILLDTFYRSADAFAILTFYLFVALVVFSFALFWAESGSERSDGLYYRNDEEFANGRPSPFRSVIATFYFTVITITTVGYGDIVPITITGKLFACLTSILGMLVIALPATVLGSNFRAVYAEHSARYSYAKAMAGDDAAMRTPEISDELKECLAELAQRRKEIEDDLEGIRVKLRIENDRTVDDMWTTMEAVVLQGLKRIEMFAEHHGDYNVASVNRGTQ